MSLCWYLNRSPLHGPLSGLDFLTSFFFAVLRALPQFAAADAAAGVRLHEELHLHHRAALRSLQPEVGAPCCFQRGQDIRTRPAGFSSSPSSFGTDDGNISVLFVHPGGKHHPHHLCEFLRESSPPTTFHRRRSSAGRPGLTDDGAATLPERNLRLHRPHQL